MSWLVILSAALLYIPLYSQVPIGGSGIKTNTRFYKVIPRAPLQTDGVFYIEDDFYMGNIHSYNHGGMEDLPLKYDLFRNQMEVIIKEQKFALNHNYIKNFDWFNNHKLIESHYVNCKEYEFPVNRLTGFFEVVVDGPTQLLFKKHVQYYRGTDSHSIMGLHGQGTITTIDLFYLGKNGKVIPLSRRRRPNYVHFGQYADQMKVFIKSHGLNFHHREDLVKIVSHYNKLSQ